MFFIVANIEQYPTFLPWIKKTQWLSSNNALVEINLGPMFASYRCRIEIICFPLTRLQQITITSNDKIFKQFSCHWRFFPYSSTAANDDTYSFATPNLFQSMVDFDFSIDVHHFFYQKIIKRGFHYFCNQLEKMFLMHFSQCGLNVINAHSFTKPFPTS